jgi:hypothetical protein
LEKGELSNDRRAGAVFNRSVGSSANPNSVVAVRIAKRVFFIFFSKQKLALSNKQND